MEKKSLYREFFPGYMGHIPYKYEVIGMTVGATNNHIKSLLTKEPDYSQIYVPSNKPDYTYYNRGYFNADMSKTYPLEEDKIFSNRSKEARTWICGNKHQLYPEHIPGYTGHVTGIETTTKKGSNIFGMSYAKASSIAVKGAYCNQADLPKDERYISEMKDRFVRPKTRSYEEERILREHDEALKPKIIVTSEQDEKMLMGLSDSFKRAVTFNRKKIVDAPYIVGYGGFRKGVISDGMYGKSFRTESIKSINKI